MGAKKLLFSSLLFRGNEIKIFFSLNLNYFFIMAVNSHRTKHINHSDVIMSVPSRLIIFLFSIIIFMSLIAHIPLKVRNTGTVPHDRFPQIYKRRYIQILYKCDSCHTFTVVKFSYACVIKTNYIKPMLTSCVCLGLLGEIRSNKMKVWSFTL